MALKKLTPEVVCLVHHVELNREGWWESALERIILATMWLSGRSRSVDEVRAILRKQFDVELSRTRTQARLDALLSRGDILAAPGNRYGVSDQADVRLGEERRNGFALEEAVKGIFLERLAREQSELALEPTWKEFNDRLLIPLVQEQGAVVYELFSQRVPSLPGTSLQRFLEAHPESERQALSRVALAFLDPSVPEVRTYVLGLLNAYFTVEAANLSQNTLRAIGEATQREAHFDVFADTNFIFSILGLHDNPANEAAVALTDLIEHLDPQVGVKLHVLDITVAEARNVIGGAIQYLARIPWTKNMATAVDGSAFGGLAQTYIHAAAIAKYPLSPREFFAPFEENLVDLLEQKNISVFDRSAADYPSHTNVMNDIDREVQFQRQRRERHPKSQNQLKHDVSLWQFARDCRPLVVDSPLAASYWVVTEDHQLMSFDRDRQRRLHERLPICLHPATLTQLLEFWIPRSTAFEEAMLGSMRLPLLFRRFDSEAEQTTVRILARLSQFEHAGNLPPETISAIVSNEGIRARIQKHGLLSPEAEAAERELIKEALVEELDRTVQHLDGLKEQATALEASLVSRDSIVEDLSIQAEALKGTIQSQDDEKTRLREELARIQQVVDAAEAERQRSRQRSRFLRARVGLPLGLTAALSALAAILARGADVSWQLSTGGVACIGLLIGLYVFNKGALSPAVEAAPWFRATVFVRRAIFWAIGLVWLLIFGALSNGVWEKAIGPLWDGMQLP